MPMHTYTISKTAMQDREVEGLVPSPSPYACILSFGVVTLPSSIDRCCYKDAVVPHPPLLMTSNQARLPAELKHINKRRKRN